MEDFVTDQAIEWARSHLAKFGDTDLLPVPFEFESIKAYWSEIKSSLSKIDLANFQARASKRYLVPKPGGGFRIVVQLDPLDSILYSALSYEIAPKVEAARIPVKRKIALSYRINPRPDGALFEEQSEWNLFLDLSKKYASMGKYEYILEADITDFYNQIYHHRVENSLESAGIPNHRAQNTERFLGQLTAKQSRGLPVGPSASILLAEACLTDVDSHIIGILNEGQKYVRWVDDFRIFLPTRKTAVRTLHSLTDYLYTSHRLTLSAAKTKIRKTDVFLRRYEENPEIQENIRRRKKLDELFENSYSTEGDDVEIDDGRLNRQTLRELFEECVHTKPLSLGLARHILRKCRKIESSVLAECIFANLENLMPVLRDVALYVCEKRCTPKARRKHFGRILIDYLKKGDFGELPYVRTWGIFMLLHCEELAPKDVAFKLVEQSRSYLDDCDRWLALFARRDKKLDWVRSKKENWRNYADWDRRALIYAASVLPRDERNAWLSLVLESDDILDRAVAVSAKAAK